MGRAAAVILMLGLLLAAGCTEGVQEATTVVATSTMPAAAAPCGETGAAPLGVLRSTDRGVTWTALGNACMEDSMVWAVDPTPLVVDDGIALYFLDLHTLTGDDSTGGQRIIYRATTSDGVNFTTPQPVYEQEGDMVDPFVLGMPDGTFRMYFKTFSEGIVSATSSDGLGFTREPGVRSAEGNTPGALLMPDSRVRLYLAAGEISSLISDDGLDFTEESGARIPTSPEFIVDNPQPLRLSDGTYLMLFTRYEEQYEGSPDPWTFTEMHLATSTDGLDWAADPSIIGYGGTSCVVEMADGTLFVYFVNA